MFRSILRYIQVNELQENYSVGNKWKYILNWNSGNEIITVVYATIVMKEIH